MSARFITIKQVNELPEDLKGLVEFQVVDDKVEAITVKSGDSFIRIVKSDSYSQNLKVLTEQPKKEVTKWKLQGLLLGLTQIEELFDTEYDANERLADYKNRAGYGHDDGLEIVPVTVLQNVETL